MELSLSDLRKDPTNPNWTIPKSYGVWELGNSGSSKKYRYGNYPIRGAELSAKFSRVNLIALYSTRAEAKQYADELNR